MLTTLIDNATVSSVQRALGKAQTRDLGVLDVEHAALGRLVEAVLLSDKVVVPDNYKQEFTPARKKLLQGLGVGFLEVPEPVDESLNTVAGSLAGPWTEAYAEGKDRSLFQQYFEQVQAYSNFIWEHSSSQFFLVFRAHGIGKESPLIEALLSSPKDDDLGKQLRIIAKDGEDVEWNNLSRHVQRMLAVMGWLGHQYIWHQVFAARHDLVYSPHPLRDFFANDFLSRVNIGASSATEFKSAFTTGVQRFKGKLETSLAALGALPGAATVELPPLLPFVVNECQGRDDFIATLNQLRNDSKIKELRSLLSQIKVDCDNGDYRRHRTLISDIESIAENLLVERGLDRRLVRVKLPTTLLGIQVEGDGAGLKLPIPPLLYKQYFFTKRYRVFLRDVLSELAAPAKFGAIKTRLNSWVWRPDTPEIERTPFYTKEYSFPSRFHRPLNHHEED